MSVIVEALTGGALVDALPALARLRMGVFREWPYLYDGSEEYEAAYLQKFAEGRGAVCILARDGAEVIGASTASPLVESDEEFIAPFQAQGYDPKTVFYCGESVLLPQYRGHGLGHAFFDGREDHARKLGGFAVTAFCRVVRPDDHPMKPETYRPLDGFWRKRGYEPAKGLVAYYPWRDLGSGEETEKPLQFWLKPLEPAAL